MWRPVAPAGLLPSFANIALLGAARNGGASAEVVEVGLSVAVGARMDALRDAFGRTREEQDAAALPVLVQAHHLVRCGWVQRLPDAIAPDGRQCFSLSGAVARAGHGNIECEYARRVLRKYAGTHDLPCWNDHPFRTRGEVLALLERAIVHCGGRLPRRGGWVVGAPLRSVS